MEFIFGMRTSGTFVCAQQAQCNKMLQKQAITRKWRAARGVARDIQNFVQTLASTHRQLHFGGYGVFVRRIDRSEVSGKN